MPEYESFQCSCSRQNKKGQFIHELYKQEKAKQKVKNSAAVFDDVPVVAA